MSELVKQFILLNETEHNEIWEDLVLQRPVAADYESYSQYLNDLADWSANLLKVNEAMAEAEAVEDELNSIGNL